MGTVKSSDPKAANAEVAKSPEAESHPRVDEISALTDTYFNKTRAIVGKFGDTKVTYAVFMRRPVISAPRLALDWLKAVAAARGASFDIDLR